MSHTLPDMPLRVDPQTAADNWEAGLGRAQSKIEAGIDRVTVSPGQKASQAADKWLNSVTQAKDRFARGSAAVSLEDWRAAAKVGASAIAGAATRKKGKYATKIAPVFTHLAAGLSRIDQMPTMSYEQRKAKAIALMDHMHAYKG